MNIYRISEDAGVDADSEYYIVIAGSEEQARELIQTAIRKRHVDIFKDGICSGGEHILPNQSRYESLVQEALEQSLEYFNNNFVHVEVVEVKEGVVFNGVFNGY